MKRSARIYRVILSMTCIFLCILPRESYPQTAGASCTSAQATAANSACNVNGCYVCTNVSGSYKWVQQPLNLGTAAAAAGSSCAGYPVGAIRYNTTIANIESCNGSTWGEFTLSQSGYSNPGTPSGNGYFVMSSGTYNGNFPGYTASGSQYGLIGADTICLYELTNNTGWKGYSTANGNGQLVAAKVHAFVCEYNACNNLMPNTTYYFANAGSGSYGGASFTTDSNGLGPYDSANWSGSTYFGGSYTYWSRRGSTSSTVWGASATGTGIDCNVNYSSASSGYNSYYGSSSSTNGGRWFTGSTTTCNNALNLICFVNP